MQERWNVLESMHYAHHLRSSGTSSTGSGDCLCRVRIECFRCVCGRQSEFLTLPFGILAPLFHLNLNFNLARSGGVLYNIFLCVATVFSYALTGWITGAVAAACFNVIAKQTGGIDAKYVSVANDESPAESAIKPFLT